VEYSYIELKLTAKSLAKQSGYVNLL